MPVSWIGHSFPTRLPGDVELEIRQKRSLADRSVRSTQLMQKAGLRGHEIQRRTAGADSGIPRELALLSIRRLA
jgi:hypothetical protein